MTLEALAVKVIEAAEAARVDFMAVGAIAAGAGVARHGLHREVVRPAWHDGATQDGAGGHSPAMTAADE